MNEHDSLLDFRTQAEQMLRIIETRTQAGQRAAALEFLILKFKALYEQGILSGRRYETQGTFPYNSLLPKEAEKRLIEENMF
jgi:hypothetical protein